MPEKVFHANEHINKRDLDLIIEVNKKAIEIEMEVATQNEEIIELLTKAESAHGVADEKLDKLVKSSEELAKDIFKIQVLFITGLLSIILQIISIFVKK